MKNSRKKKALVNAIVGTAIFFNGRILSDYGDNFR